MTITTTVGTAQSDSALAPVTEDFSAYIIAGAVSADESNRRSGCPSAAG